MQRLLILILLLLSTCGCESIRHEMQAHRLWRLNYHEPPGRTDGVYFSVEDHLIATPSDSEAAKTPPVAQSVPGRP